MTLRLVNLSFALFLLCLPVFPQAKSRTEKADVLRRCEEYFGTAVDARLNLYEANSFYVLQASFDSKNRLERLRIVPKYYFEEDHPGWGESDSFEYLSSVQYQNMLTRVDLIRPRGELVTPSPPFSPVTNGTAWTSSIYEKAKLTIGILVEVRESEDAPFHIKSFELEFGKKVKKKSEEWVPLSIDLSIDASD